MAILLMVIDGYYIISYCWLLYVILQLFFYYCIINYCLVLYVIISQAISSYYIVRYLKLFFIGYYFLF
jgi:hypothetical protein